MQRLQVFRVRYPVTDFQGAFEVLPFFSASIEMELGIDRPHEQGESEAEVGVRRYKLLLLRHHASLIYGVRFLPKHYDFLHSVKERSALSTGKTFVLHQVGGSLNRDPNCA